MMVSSKCYLPLLGGAVNLMLFSLADHFSDSDFNEGEFYPPFPLLYAMT